MRAAPIVLALLGGTAAADSFSGFSGVERAYLVGQDRVCAPLAVSDKAAAGAPKCQKAGEDVVAKLSIKAPLVQSGPKAAFSATASGTKITVASRTGGLVVAWDAGDPIGKIADVFASQYEDRVAVAFTVRRLGHEVTDVVAFDLGVVAKVVEPTAPATPDPVAAPADPAVTKLVDAARKAQKGKQLAAWRAVLAADPQHSEALYRAAAAGDAASLFALGKSKRADAIEWLVEARFDPAFASSRADASFRAAVGLDRKPAGGYERLMGFGGQWEQTGTSCDKPEVRLTAARDRSVRVRVKSACEGAQFDQTFKGAWRLDGDKVVLSMAAKGAKATAADEAPCVFEAQGDEDALRCVLGRDLEFVVLPTRR